MIIFLVTYLGLMVLQIFAFSWYANKINVCGFRVWPLLMRFMDTTGTNKLLPSGKLCC